jgi:hypothetical protein
MEEWRKKLRDFIAEKNLGKNKNEIREEKILSSFYYYEVFSPVTAELRKEFPDIKYHIDKNGMEIIIPYHEEEYFYRIFYGRLPDKVILWREDSSNEKKSLAELKLDSIEFDFRKDEVLEDFVEAYKAFMSKKQVPG